MSNRRSRRRKLPVEAVDLEITALSHEGRGISHIDGKVAFVDGALKNELVSANYVRSRGKFDELRTTSVLRPALERVEPACRFAGQCGGCSLQHMNTDAQIDFKQSVLTDQLRHSANLDPESYRLLPQLQARVLHYRRKARLAVRVVLKKGGALVGFREKYSSFITDMDSCEVLIEDVAILIQPLRELIDRLSKSHAIPQIEVAVGECSAEEDSKFQIALVVRHLEALASTDVQLLEEFAATHTLQLYLQPGGVDTVHKIFPADDQERLHYYLPAFGLQLAFHPMDFTQINGEINRLIIERTVELLDLQDDDRVLDLFCGLGNFTLPVATRCAEVVGVEGSEEMVKRGNENAQLNGISNSSFFAANLCDSIRDKPWFSKPYTKIILDPPRSGAIEIIEQVAEIGASKIMYVSCNPATLARDSAYLIAKGYKLSAAGVMDMFPHTTHVESMALFELDS